MTHLQPYCYNATDCTAQLEPVLLHGILQVLNDYQSVSEQVIGNSSWVGLVVQDIEHSTDRREWF